MQIQIKTLLSRFTRVTSSGKYMPEIDGLRFLAIVAVLLYHAHILFFAKAIPESYAGAVGWDWLNLLMGQGWFGVQVFFVISGFVLAVPFASQYLGGAGRRPIDLKSYYSRRIIRIGYPYFIALTLGLVLKLLNGGDPSDSLAHYGAGLIYANALFFDGTLNPILSVSWTLEIEIQFYLLAPFLCAVFRIPSVRWRVPLLVTAILGIQLITEALMQQPGLGFLGHTLIGQIHYFVAGLLLADLYLSFWKGRATPVRRAYGWDLLGVMAWVAVPLGLTVAEAHFWLPLVLLIAFSAVLRGRFLNRLLSHPLVAAIGGMCYSIYLFHSVALYNLHGQWIRPLFQVEKGDWPYNLLPLVVVCLLTLMVCAIAYLLVERPSMRWSSRRATRGPGRER